jgi:secondary thiamine-phosphate synthase enzyme
MVITQEIRLNTKGHCDMHDITRQVAETIRETKLANGIVTVFTPSSTSGLTTIEFESGALADLERSFDELVPIDRDYRHNMRWGDGNGHSHVRAALTGPSITIPFVGGRMTLGTWQQLILIDFDNRSRSRRLVVQVIGEPSPQQGKIPPTG